MLMEDRFYTVVRIDGDYAVLLPDGGTAEDEFPVARALLPAEADEGVRSGTGTVCLCLTFHRKEILQKFFRRGASRRGAFLFEEGCGRWGRP